MEDPTQVTLIDVIGTLGLDRPLSVEELEALRKGATAVIVTIDQALDEQRLAASRALDEQRLAASR